MKAEQESTEGVAGILASLDKTEPMGNGHSALLHIIIVITFNLIFLQIWLGMKMN